MKPIDNKTLTGSNTPTGLSFQPKTNHEYMVLPVNDFPTGIYVIELTTGTKVEGSAKLVVSH